MTTVTNKTGVAIIGTSGVGGQHAKALLGINDALLTGVWGSNPGRTDDFARRFNIKAYSSLKELLADETVQIVDIVGIHNQHASFGIQSAREGKHVIVEKPLDSSIQAARNLIDECRRNKVYLATIFQHRRDEAMRKLKKAIDNCQLGRIYSASICVSKERSQEYYNSSGGWRGKKELSGGGVLINQAIHLIDSLVFLFGEAASVYGQTEIFNHDIEVEDVGVGVIRFRNNVLATIQASTAGSANMPETLEVFGTKGSARIEGETLTFFRLEKSLLDKLISRVTSKLRHRLPFALKVEKRLKPGCHKNNLSEIIEAIRNNQKPPASFEEGLKSLEIVKALIESARTEKPVKIRLAAINTFDKNYLSSYLSEVESKRPKVLIINPLNETKSNAAFSHIGKHRLRQPLGLAYISSFLKRVTEVQLVDTAILGWDSKKTIGYINKINPETLIISSDPLDRWQNPDLDISAVFEILNQTKVKNKILVGAHGSVTPDWIFKNCQVDFIVRGEPEITCLELVRNLLGRGVSLEKIDGLSWRKKNNVHHNRDRIFEGNLDEYPLPDYLSLPMHLYRYTTSDLPEPFSLILSSRGCPAQCLFCLKTMMPDKYRFRSAQNVYEEMKYLHNNFAIRSFYFQDWEFLLNKERVKNLCRFLIDTPAFDIRWGCSARASSFDPETIKLMKEAGCILINFGFESGSQEILNMSKKGVSLHKVKAMIELCRKEGMNIRPFCLVNLPGETRETIKESARFIIENNLDVPHINIPIPYPGTKLAETVKSNSWEKALALSGKVQTTIDPKTARKLLRKYIWQGKFGFFYFFNPRFWLYSLDVLKRKFSIW